MFNNDIANTLGLEFAAADTAQNRQFIYVRYAMEFGLKSGHTGGNTRRIKALVARLLDAAEEMIGDALPKRCLFRHLLKLDGLTPDQRKAARHSLGQDQETLKQFVTEDLKNALLNRSVDPEVLKAPLKDVLKGRLGHLCWKSSVKDSEIKTAVANVITKMFNNLAAGEVLGGPLVEVSPYKRRKPKKPATQEVRGLLSASASGRYARRKGDAKKKA